MNSSRGTLQISYDFISQLYFRKAEKKSDLKFKT